MIEKDYCKDCKFLCKKYAKDGERWRFCQYSREFLTYMHKCPLNDD